MSNLLNQNWIGFNGEPITGVTPPSIRLMAGVMTPALFSEVAHRYHLFCLNKRTAAGNYFVSDKVLADGSRVRMVSHTGLDVVFVWSSSKSEFGEEIYGFICRPTNDVKTSFRAASYKYWGKPFTVANKPLGTPMGTMPCALIQPAKDKVNAGKYLDKYKVTRPMPDDKHGQVDWQGENPEKDVLSWNAMSWNKLSFNSLGNPEYDWHAWYPGANDYEKFSVMVHRCRNIGYGDRIYSKLAAIKVFDSGVVEGACWSSTWGGRSLVAVLRKASGGSNEHQFVKVGSTDAVIGTYTVSNKTVNLHGWYFNKTGTKARCTFASKTDQYAVEATLAAGGVTFSVIASSRTDSDSDTDFIVAEAIWTPSLSTQSGSFSSSASLSTTGSMSEKSPAFYADYHDDVGVLAVIKREVKQAPVFGSTYEKISYVGGGDHKELTRNLTGPVIKMSAQLVADGGAVLAEAEIGHPDLGFSGSETLTQTKAVTALGGGNYHTTFTQVGSSPARTDFPGTVGHVLDVDARTLAILIHGYSITSGESSYDYLVESPPGSVTGVASFTSIAYPFVSKEKVQTRSGAESAVSFFNVDDQSRPEVDYEGPADEVPSPGVPWTPYSPITNGVSDLAYSFKRKEQTLQGWQSITNNGGNGGASFGMVRTFGGKAISSSLVRAGGNSVSLGDADEVSVSHILPAVDGANDACVLVNIESQDLPWLARLGVV